eukprot:TRINITY_DN32218_c0_g1_i1.p1 TRINITY_DN32218_c0_g1~~TRINITY_DN32218_c0_g1_i1.p1  ORF type:complete len:188 (+),score=42.20 TRINITY_DN32218_c0_g1_i1:64-564(+)
MGLSYEEVERLRTRYPDRLQTGSKLADLDTGKEYCIKAYAVGGMWASYGLFMMSNMLIVSNLKKGSHYDASVSIFAPSKRAKTFKLIGHTAGGFGLALAAYLYHTSIEKQTAAVWAIQAAHLGEFKPKGERFLDKHFPVEELEQYSTVAERARTLRMWQDKNVMSE